MIKHNFNIKVTTQLFNNKLLLEGSVNYINQKIYNQNADQSGYSAVTGIISFPVLMMTGQNTVATIMRYGIRYDKCMFKTGHT